MRLKSLLGIKTSSLSIVFSTIEHRDYVIDIQSGRRRLQSNMWWWRDFCSLEGVSEPRTAASCRVGAKNKQSIWDASGKSSLWKRAANQQSGCERRAISLGVSGEASI
ncbi:unnamed protein product [Cuscuta epithymum]|uniref:Uncharacterized protein n=1 Tax=Cuscuta epithymum TaxID=186058 RepID=A0AAV0G0M6_9ASTE|nr:unnamed protein product [Cuscuta epithymum]